MLKSLQAKQLVTFVLLTLGCALAQEPILDSPGFSLAIDPEAKIISRFDNGWETRLVVEQKGQRVRINWGEDHALLLFPNSTLRLQNTQTPSGINTVAYLNGKKYEVKRSKKEIGWLLPGQEVFFRTRGGKVTQAVGSSDFLKLRRDTPSGRLTLESGTGITDALLNSEGKLETFDGPEFGDHIYFVRGLAFKRGPVTLRIPLPKGPFLNALPTDRYLTIKSEIEGIPEPAAQTQPERDKDPLQAEPYTWSSPELRAKSGESGADPLNTRREKIVKHPTDPLKARTSEDSEEVLRAKGY